MQGLISDSTRSTIIVSWLMYNADTLLRGSMYYCIIMQTQILRPCADLQSDHTVKIRLLEVKDAHDTSFRI